MFRIEEFKFKEGTRRSVMFDQVMLAYYPNLFITQRQLNSSVSTQSLYLRSVAILHVWAAHEKIDLEDRFIKGRHLDEFELARLVDFCSWTAETRLKITSNIKMLKNAYKQVSVKTSSSTVHAIREYISYLFLKLAKTPDKFEVNKRVEDSLNSMKPSVNSRVRARDVVSMKDEQIQLLLQATFPQDPRNPWANPSVRIRNYLIICVLFETGMRRGELAALHVEDFDLDRKRIAIRRRHDDKKDPRKNQPRAKTNERDIPIPDSLATNLNEYVTNHRSRVKGSRKHPYLFVAHNGGSGFTKGSPISLVTVNKIFYEMRALFAALNGVTPHTLRHHMNYRISQWLDVKFKDRTPEERSVADANLRSYLNGWNRNSSVQEVYNKRYVREQAEQFMNDREVGLNGLNKGVDHEKN